MSMPVEEGLHAMVAQVIATQTQIITTQTEIKVQLAVVVEVLKTIPDHEARLREVERVQAQDKGASRLKASLWTSAASLVSAAAALWVAIAHAR